MDEFVNSAAGSAIGALVGALAAFAVGAAGDRRRDRSHDNGSIANLLVDAATRRGFVIDDSVARLAPHDLEHLVRAVFDHRKDIRRTRRLLRLPTAEALRELVAMTAACNDFLEWSQWSDDLTEAATALRVLRDRLELSGQRLHGVAGLSEPYWAPGSKAFM